MSEIFQAVETIMFPRRGRSYKTEQSPLPLSHWKSWCALAVGLALASLALSLFTFSPLIGGQGAERNRSPVASGFCLLLLFATMWAARRAALNYYAYKPGPVDVQKFVAATPEGRPKPPVDALTARFRKQLSETDLYAPTNLPAEAPAENFLDLLGDVNLEPQKLPTSLLRFTSHIRPKIAYHVSGVLTVRNEKPSCGLTVTLTSYVIRGSRAETLWAPSWEEVIGKAGYWVVAALLPITKAGRKQPWRGWRGGNLPVDLFAAYQRARELSKARKFDQSLDNYYQAIRWDPRNAYIRNQIGATQEKLGLHLDALETYFGVLALGRQGRDKDNDRLWARPISWRRIAQQWSLSRQPGVLQARYRFAVVLGTSEQTATQWCKSGTDDHARATARKQIRTALAPVFVDRYWRAVCDLAGFVCAECYPYGQRYDTCEECESKIRSWLSAWLDLDKNRDQGEDKRQRVVALIFQRASALEMCRLVEDYPVVRFFLRFHADEIALTRTALRVNRDVWAPLRLTQTWNRAEGDVSAARSTLPTGKTDSIPREFHKFQTKSMLPDCHLHWRAGVTRAAEAVAKALENRDVRTLESAVRRALLHPFDQNWQGHYNAACVYAVALKSFADDARVAAEREHAVVVDRRDKLARLACRELETAIRKAESDSVQLRRSWLLFEDPDLTELRKTPEFFRFTREFFPHATPDLPPFQAVPTGQEAGPTVIEIAAYDRTFLEEVGKAMERVWHHRGTTVRADVHTMRDWFMKEQRVWELIDVICASGARNWQNRMGLLLSVHDAAEPTLQARIELPAAVPEFDQVSTDSAYGEAWTDPGTVIKHMDELPRQLDRELRGLHEKVHTGSQCSPIRSSRGFLEETKRCDASGLNPFRPEELELICTRFAATWQAFTAQFSLLVSPAAEYADIESELEAFGTALGALHRTEEWLTARTR